MGALSCILIPHMPLHILSLIILCSSIQVNSPVEGRPSPELQAIVKENGDEKLMVRSLIGSRPPKCANRCTSCGHCEAVQVPVIPESGRSGIRKFFHTTFYRGEYTSNYKPMSWKCKCGNIIFNP